MKTSTIAWLVLGGGLLYWLATRSDAGVGAPIT